MISFLSASVYKLYRAFGNVSAFAKTKTCFFVIFFGLALIPLLNYQQGFFAIVAYIGVLSFIILYKLDFLLQSQNRGYENQEFRVRQLVVEEHNAMLLSVRHPLAFMPVSDYSMKPNNLMLLEATFHSKKPSLTLELGSGLSTHLLSSLIKSEGKGHVVSFDDDADWVELTRHYLKHNGLSEFAEVFHVPLIQHEGDSSEWYDYRPYQNKLSGIDLLVVDGPPAMITKTIREGALFHLYDFLNDGAVIFVDDANRIGEHQVVENWRKAYPKIQAIKYQTLSGACIITVHKK
jgi:predicted O-methyltransferase YrrM